MNFSKFIFAFLALISSAVADPVTAVARYGKPQLETEFKQFPHVNPQAPKGGALRLSTVGTFDSLNSRIVKGIPAEGLMITLDPLMKRAAGEPFTLYALIAEKVDIASDSSTITIYINPKARFHDNTPITAQDVKFTIELLIEKGLPRYRQYFSQIEKMVVKDATTLEITFKKGEHGYDPELPLMVLLVCPLSQKDMEGKDFATSGLSPLLGSGPYKIDTKTVEPGRSIAYERVPDYWAAGLPVNVGMHNFDRIQIDYYKNTASQFQSFIAGGFDVYFDSDPNHWNTAYEAIPAVKSEKIKLYKIAHQRPVAVKVIAFNMRRENFTDIRVRKALELAFDFDTLNKLVFYSAMKRPTSLFANTVLAHEGKPMGKELEILERYRDQIDPDILNGPYTPSITNGNGDQRENLAKADKLLNEAGWNVINGKRIKNGEILSFEFLIKDPKLEKMGLAFQKGLEKLGILLNVRLVDPVQYEARTSNRDFDMIVHTWANSLSPGNEQGYYFSAKNADINGSSNYIGIKDPFIEKLATEIPFSNDYETLAAQVHALDRVVMNKYFMIPLSYDPHLYFAVWGQRIAFPPIDARTGMNIIESGWALAQETPIKTGSLSTTKIILIGISGIFLLGILYFGITKLRRRAQRMHK